MNIEKNMQRYERQLSLSEIGVDGQQKLQQSRVLVVGAGGLGSPVALYLAAAGVGNIGIIDPDVVGLGNLQRQILYTEHDIGKSKAAIATQRILERNSDIRVDCMDFALDPHNIADVMQQYDIVVDCCDNFDTRYLIDNQCILSEKTYIYGAIQGFEGQVSVFDPQLSTFRYRDLYPETPASTSKSVVGPTAAVVGAVEAHEALKTICGYGNTLVNRLWTINLKTMQSQIIEL